jgi:Xaa-Pro aminopeptidase
LQKKIQESSLDCLIISNINNIRYLSGFKGSDAWMLVTMDKACIAVDFRYYEQVNMEVSCCQIVSISGDLKSWLLPLIRDVGAIRIGFESDSLPYSIYMQIKDLLCEDDKATKVIPLSKFVESIRLIKEPDEIDNIEKAVRLTDSAIEYAVKMFSPDISEISLAWEVEKYLRENGSETVPFEIIAAAGENAALPHARPSNKLIKPNQPLLIDVGARINGYCSDVSRSYYIGKQDETFQKVYDIVLAAQTAALNLIEAGMTGQQADYISRTVIEKSGYAKYFGHSLGHGVGLDVHESPRLGPNSLDILSDNMVFTIEPGIYLPGWGGIRIEDTVVLNNGKLKSISGANKLLN